MATDRRLVEAISIHALREGGRQKALTQWFNNFQFLSTPSARRATPPVVVVIQPEVISIHALREEGDLWSVVCTISISDFYPRPPRGRPITRHRGHTWTEFLSTPSARRATDRPRG